MLYRFFSSPAELPDGEKFRSLNDEGLVIQAEIYRLQEVEAMIVAAEYYANDED